MTRPDFREIERLYHAALEVAGAERSDFLKRACRDNLTLLREVESLLAANDNAGEFIHTPALADAAAWVADDDAPSSLAAGSAPTTSSACSDVAEWARSTSRTTRGWDERWR